MNVRSVTKIDLMIIITSKIDYVILIDWFMDLLIHIRLKYYRHILQPHRYDVTTVYIE